MKYSEQLNELAAALAKAQSEMEGAAKDKVNPHFKSKYADLGSIWDAIRAPLTKSGLSVVQLPSMDAEGRVLVSTMLLHSSGQYIEASYALPATKPDAQGFGSAITYMKRYALTGMGVAPEDDDGNASVRRNGDESLPPQGLAPPPEGDRKAAAKKWGEGALLTVQGFKNAAEFSAWHRQYATAISTVRDFNEALHKRLTDAIQAKNFEFYHQPLAAE